MKVIQYIFVILSIFSLNIVFAEEPKSPELLCADEKYNLYKYLKSNRQFLESIKETYIIDNNRLHEMDKYLKKMSNTMIDCVSRYHVQNTDAATKTIYYKIMNSLTSIFPEILIIKKKDPDFIKYMLDSAAIKDFYDRYDRLLMLLENDLGKSV